MRKMNFGIILVFAVLALVSTVSAFAPISFPYDGNLVVTYVSSDAGYNNEFGLLLPGPLSLGKIHDVSPQAYTNVGRCANGKEVVLYIKNDPGNIFPSNANGADGVNHAIVTSNADKSYTVAFEDLWGGGDGDYNDVIMNVACTQDPVNAPEFPTLALPAALIVGMLGVVLFVQRTKEN